MFFYGGYNSSRAFLTVATSESALKSSNWSSLMGLLGQFFFLIAVFAFIIFLAVYSLRFAQKIKGMAGGTSNLRVVESRALGTNNFIHLVKAGNKYLLIGSSKENVRFLAELDKDSLADQYDTTLSNTDANTKRSKFENQMAKHINNLLNRTDNKEGESNEDTKDI